jgi:Spy/CpxP family protein refolding chaperone
MSTGKSMLIIAAIGLLALPVVSLAGGRAGDAPGPCGHRPGGFFGRHEGGLAPKMLLGRLGDKLELTDAQRDQIRALFEQNRAAMRELRSQLETAHNAYREAHPPGSFDEASARTFAQSQAQIQAEMTVKRMQVEAQVFNLLTPAQQDTLKQLRERHAERFGPGHEHRNMEEPEED